MQHALKKAVWSDADLADMSFHDVKVRSWLADEDAFELLLDLDYLFEWVQPAAGETHFRFWVAPVTMVFENACDVRIDIRSAQGRIEIENLRREDPKPTPNGAFVAHRYRFECQEGEIGVTATGFKMYVRRTPLLVQTQGLDLMQRDGVGFGRALQAG